MAATPPTTAVPRAQLPQAVPYPPQASRTVNMNQVAVRQHLDVAAVHAKALEKLDTLSLWQEARAEALSTLLREHREEGGRLAAA